MSSNIQVTNDVFEIRLKRNYNRALNLQRKMTSYRYEPKDYEGFIRLRNLRTELKDLTLDQLELLQKVKEQQFDFKTSETIFETIFLRYKQLDRDIARYVLDIQKG
ncbi:hypothetical protein [Croceitalea sp. P059]|uniref:hypothetical protein n=1 Tax=Croceitalea sp. P059 TaxID=3075601 RepID=UPI0028885CA8|nr:hypothetical protein [Croceitalea sp. P059]MDT0539769.1 hypothetical protein [Croceitalea sp. P059]